MRAILDTNILIHRESSVVVHNDIGSLFNWLDRLGYEKLIGSSRVLVEPRPDMYHLSAFNFL